MNKMILMLFILSINVSLAQPTALTNTFTYQGELKFNNALANGSYDFEFSVFDLETDGSALEVVAINGITVTNGVFSTPITLTNDLFTGNKIWLDIAVKTNGTADPFDPLAPRQEVASSPYAIHAQFVDLSTVPSWNMGGNAVANGDFIGTTNGQPLVMKVANEKVLRIDQATNSVTGFHAPHVVIGASSNAGGSLSIGGTTVTGGQNNNAIEEFATVTGGIGNEASGIASIVTGGYFNAATGFASTVSGGYLNQAGSDYSFAVGRYATVRNPFEAGTGSGDKGTFIWSDSTANAFNKFTSTGPNQFLINANGGVGIGTNDPNGFQLNIFGSSYLRNNLDTSSDVDLVLGGSGNNLTDDGVLSSDLSFTSSDLRFIANDSISFILDSNIDNDLGEFSIQDGNSSVLFNVKETGIINIPNSLITNNLAVGATTTNGQVLNVLGSSYLRNDLDTSTAADLVLGGASGNASDDGVLTSDLSVAGSDLIIKSNDAIVMSVGGSSTTGGALTVRSGAGVTLLQVNGNGVVDIPGSLNVTGNISKGGGTFKIDHPLDPKNKYLYHSFIESPDMMNVYNNNITTDKYGEAWVELPEYFEALNRDFRYQLTVIGSFARAMVAKEITDNKFLIKTDEPDVKVSWQVTGIRHDAYAQKNRVQVEAEKPESEKGSYLYPKAWEVTEE